MSHSISSLPLRLILAPLVLVAGGCSARPDAHATPPADSSASDEATRVAIGVNFRGPESVRYDAEQDVYFISNVNGGMSSKDGNGYIVRVSAEDPARSSIFVRSGQGGVSLDAPKGLAISGDTLWVTDIDVLQGFDRHSGAHLATVDLRPFDARFLNDIAVGPDGTLYLTDTGILVDPRGRIPVGGDRVFHIGADHVVSVLAAGDSLHEPNGITWDPARRRWIVVPFADLVSYVLALDSTSMRRIAVVPSRGQFDGVEVVLGGRLLVTSWGDSAVYLVNDSSSRKLIGGLVSPADMGIDTRRNVLAVPLPNADRVEYWKLALR